jgi:aldehyde:ferredoxin oxidoreductase
MEPMIRGFYKVMDWNDQGVPTEKKLAELGISPASFPNETAA